MEVVRNQARHDGVPAYLILNVLAELSAAVDAMRQEMARLGIHASDAPATSSFTPPSREAAPGLDDLSKRQRQVLAGVVRGRANKVIAWELGLSVRTVEAYRAQLFERLGARNTADAVRLALAAGLAADQSFDELVGAEPTPV
jgi:DNA-binding NarL/FixJ family response regulator